MKRFMMTGAMAFLAACGGTTVSLDTQDSNLSADDIIDRTFRDQAATLELFSGADREEIGATLTSPSSGNFTLGNDSVFFTNVDGSGYSSALGGTIVFGTEVTGAPETPDVIYLAGATNSGELFYGVDGTRSNNLPSSGFATYTGVANSVSQVAETASGSVSVFVNFGATADVDVQLSNVDPARPTAIFTALDVDVSGNQFAGDLTILGETDTVGDVRGGFFGSSADQAAGTYIITEDTPDLIGVFAATD